MKKGHKSKFDKQEKVASPRTSGTQDAETLLKAGHRKIEELFDEFDNAESQQAQAQATKKLCNQIIAHVTLKEQVLFPACRLHGLDEEELDIAQIHLDGMKLIVADLMQDRPDAPYYRAKIKVLKQQFKDQTEKEEASDGLLATAKEKGADMDDLGRELQERQQELTEQENTQSLRTPALRALMSSETQNDSQHKEERMNKQYREQGQSRGQSHRDDDDHYTSRGQRNYGSENYGSQNAQRYQDYGSRGYGSDYGSESHGQQGRGDYDRRSQRYGQEYDRSQSYSSDRQSQDYRQQNYGRDNGQHNYGQDNQRNGQQRYRQTGQSFGGSTGYHGDYPERSGQRYRPDYDGEYSQNGQRRRSDYESDYAQRSRAGRNHEADYGSSGRNSDDNNGRYSGEYGSSNYGGSRQQRGYSGQRYGRNEDSDMQSRSRNRYSDDDDDRDMPIW